MRSRVNDIIMAVIMRKVGITRSTVESKLQDQHPGNIETLPERLHLRCDDAKVLGDERQSPTFDGVEQRLQQGCPGRLDPAAFHRCLRMRGYLPISLKPAKVVNSNPVIQHELPLEPREPPAKTIGLHALPPIMRIAPALSGRREIVRRNTRNDTGTSMLVEIEFIPSGPDIGAVARYKNRDIAKEQDAAVIGIRPQSLPLLEKDKLLKIDLTDTTRQSLARGAKCRGSTITERCGPVMPA